MAPDISTGSDTRQHPAEGIQLAAGLSRQHGLAVFPVDRESRSNGLWGPGRATPGGDRHTYFQLAQEGSSVSEIYGLVTWRTMPTLLRAQKGCHFLTVRGTEPIKPT